MRRVLVTLAAIVTMAGARNADAQEVSWGFKGGIVLASLETSGPGAFETDDDAGGTIGGFVGWAVTGIVRIQPEVLVTTRRFWARNVGSPFGISATGVEVPLLVHFRFPEGRRAQAVLFAGPQLGAIANVTQAMGQTETDISDQVKDLDVGATFGGGVELPAGPGALVLDVRISLGLRNLSESSDPSFKSRAALVLAGYRF